MNMYKKSNDCFAKNMKSRSNFDHSLAEKNIKKVNEDLWKVQVQRLFGPKAYESLPFKRLWPE